MKNRTEFRFFDLISLPLLFEYRNERPIFLRNCSMDGCIHHSANLPTVPTFRTFRLYGSAIYYSDSICFFFLFSFPFLRSKIRDDY